jgi:hypothetical protein
MLFSLVLARPFLLTCFLMWQQTRVLA